MLERDLFRLLEGTADAAFSVDEQGVICSWNEAAEKIFGYPASAVLEKPCAQLFEGRGPLGTVVCSEPCRIIECVQAHQKVSNYDMEIKHRTGRRIWVNVSILVFRDERMNRQLVVHLARDAGARKKSENLTRKLVEIAQQVSTLARDPSQLPPASPLTEQERRVLRLFGEGKTPGKIAKELGITPRTLRNHLHHANQKLQTHSRLEAVVQANRRGLI